MLVASIAAAAPAGATGASRADIPEGGCPVAPTANGKYVTAIYEFEFNRCPDASGLASWTAALNGGMSRLTFVRMLDFSDEALANDVGYAYDYWLDRTPSSSEVAGWAANIRQSGSDDTLYAVVAGSDEAYQYYLSEDDNNTANADNDWLNDVYNYFLARDLDEGSYYFWSAYIENGPNHTSTMARRIAMVSNVIVSDEAGRALITDAYHYVLDRAPDSSGTAYWLSWYQQNHDNLGLFERFLASDEFYNDSQNQVATAQRAAAQRAASGGQSGPAGRASAAKAAKAATAAS